MGDIPAKSKTTVIRIIGPELEEPPLKILIDGPRRRGVALNA